MEEIIYSNIQTKDCGTCSWGVNQANTGYEIYGCLQPPCPSPCTCGTCEPPPGVPTSIELIATPCE